MGCRRSGDGTPKDRHDYLPPNWVAAEPPSFLLEAPGHSGPAPTVAGAFEGAGSNGIALIVSGGLLGVACSLKLGPARRDTHLR